MAKMTITDDFSDELDGLTAETLSAVASRALYAGAGKYAEALKNEIMSLKVDPETTFRRNIEQRPINVVSETLRRELAEHVGIAKHEVTEDGDHQTAVGIDGYSMIRTKKYPNGIPLIMIARSINSGSSVRRKDPFIRRALNKATEPVQEAMRVEGEKAIEEAVNSDG